ncbi:MAG: ABC transporter permease subunit [Syntrophomonadaceae bacterium]
MNIVARELRANLKSLTIWCIAMILLIAVGMIKYAGLAGAGPGVAELIGQLPEAIKSILGLDWLDPTTIAGYYGVFFLYFMLLGGIHAVMLGAAIISKEERDKTADFLFVKPVRRRRVITAKLSAVMVNLVVFNLVTLLASMFFAARYNTGSSINRQIVCLMLALFFLQVIFAAIGAGISGLVRKPGKALSYAATLFLVMFFLSSAIELYPKIDFLQYLTPFRYFPIGPVMQGTFEPLFIVLTIAISLVFAGLTYLAFQKRDLLV